jgi:hypothetical protein
MDTIARNWSVKKLVNACTSRPAQEEVWREFVRRFHPIIQISVSNVFAHATGSKSWVKQEPCGEIINDLVQGVYRRLTENDRAALRDMSCAGVESVTNYLLLISINTVRNYFRASAKGTDGCLRSAYSEIPFELCYPVSQNLCASQEKPAQRLPRLYHRMLRPVVKQADQAGRKAAGKCT